MFYVKLQLPQADTHTHTHTHTQTPTFIIHMSQHYQQ